MPRAAQGAQATDPVWRRWWGALAGGTVVPGRAWVATAALAALVVVQGCALLGLRDVGAGGTWLLAQTLPGLAVCVWVRGLSPSSTALYAWTISQTGVTLVGMAMALTGWWYPNAVMVVVLLGSAASLMAFLRVCGVLDLRPVRVAARRAFSLTQIRTSWLAVFGMAVCVVAARPHRSGPGRSGLIALVGPLWVVGMACVVVAVAAALATRVSPWLPVLAACVVPVLSQALVYGLPAIPSAARHVGVVDYVLHYHRVRPGEDIYQAWSGLFAGQAWVVQASGVHDLFTVATWWPVLGMTFEVVAVRVLAGRFLSPSRSWAAAGAFCLGNSLNTVYFAPQVLAFAPALAVLALTIAPARGRTRTVARSRLVLLLPVVCAVVVIHQITPFIVAAALIAMVLTRTVRPWWVPAVPLVPAIGWAFVNRGTLTKYVEPSAVGDVLANITPPAHPPGALPQPLVTTATFGVPALGLLAIGLAALVSLLRHRDRTSWTLALAAVSPLGLSLGTNYGGEGIFRITLFALPWLAILAFYRPAPVGRRVALVARRRPVVAVAAGLATAVLVSISVVGQTGMDWARITRPGAVVADRTFELTSPPQAILLDVGTSNATPAQQTWRYLQLAYTSRDELAAKGTTGYPRTSGARYDPDADLRALTDRFSRAPGARHYALVSTQIGAYDERYGNQSYADYRRLAAAFAGSSEWTLVRHTSDADLYALADGR